MSPRDLPSLADGDIAQLGKICDFYEKSKRKREAIKGGDYLLFKTQVMVDEVWNWEKLNLKTLNFSTIHNSAYDPKCWDSYNTGSYSEGTFINGYQT